MSSFIGSVQPSLAIVRTDGALKGANIAEDAMSAKAIVAQIVHNPSAKSSQSLAAETVVRAQARLDSGKGISKFQRVAEGLAAEGLDVLAIAGLR